MIQPDSRVVFIDGPKLVRLMIDHGVGVSTAETLKIGRVGLDWFAEA